jgi:F-type H+-transporting ATPase subunit delta
MKNNTVIKRYAQALLDLGKADGKYAQYGQELKSLAEAISGLGDEARPLTSPAFPEGVRRAMLKAVVARAGLSPLVSNFVYLLMDKDRLGELVDIAAKYNQLADEERGVVQATITTAQALAAKDIEAINRSLSTFAGRAVELAVELDPSIIGGVVARLGDLTIDGSVRTQINKLAEKLDNLR